METIPAIKMTQASPDRPETAVDLYVTGMNLAQLKAYTKVDQWAPDNEDGYQRPPTLRRYRDIAKYILQGKGVMPTSILLGVRPDASSAIKTEGFTEHQNPISSGLVSPGTLILQDGLELWNVDGQHRVGGVGSAYETDGYTELERYTFPVVIMWEVDRIEEMQHFSTINTEQKKMQTDIVDRHLVAQLEKLGEDALVTSAKTTGQGQKNVMRALTTRVVDGLNSQGLWQKNITIPGDPNNSKGLVRQHAMVVSLEPFMSDLGLGALDHQERIIVINRYWDAIGQLCSEAISSPQDYRLQATVGIYSLHRALPAIAQVCQSRGGMKPEIIKAVLSETEDVFTSDFWSKNPEVGHSLTLGTGMGSIRALAQYIINRLPVKSGGVIL